MFLLLTVREKVTDSENESILIVARLAQRIGEELPVRKIPPELEPREQIARQLHLLSQRDVLDGLAEAGSQPVFVVEDLESRRESESIIESITEIAGEA